MHHSTKALYTPREAAGRLAVGPLEALLPLEHVETPGAAANVHATIIEASNENETTIGSE
jgi:hypothetical protein